MAAHTAGEASNAGTAEPDGQSAPDGRSNRRQRSFLRELPIIVITALVISVLIKTFLVQAFFIPSGSMEPTLHGCPRCLGDRVLVDKLVSHTGGIHRGDIVVFRDTSGWLHGETPSPGLREHLHNALEFTMHVDTIIAGLTSRPIPEEGSPGSAST